MQNIPEAGGQSLPLPEAGSIRAVVLQSILQQLDAERGSLKTLLAARGLGAVRIMDPYAAIGLAEYLDLFDAMAQQLGDPMLGARLGAGGRPGDLGPLGLLALQSGSIRAALRRAARFTVALQTGTSVALLEDEEGAILSWVYRVTAAPGHPRRQDNEYSLASMCNLVRMAFHPGFRPLEVHFEHGIGGTAPALERLFGCPVRFGQASNRLLVERAEAERSWRQEDGDLIALIERHIADLIAAAVPMGTVAEQVRAQIGLRLGAKPVDLAAIAAELGLAPRSLQRRLADEGLSLRALVQAHRQALAETLMAEGTMSVAAVAAALGYADPTAFWRAHRDWTGRAPTQALSRSTRSKSV